jgi:hypothetical protein
LTGYEISYSLHKHYAKFLQLIIDLLNLAGQQHTVQHGKLKKFHQQLWPLLTAAGNGDRASQKKNRDLQLFFLHPLNAEDGLMPLFCLHLYKVSNADVEAHFQLDSQASPSGLAVVTAKSLVSLWPTV